MKKCNHLLAQIAFLRHVNLVMVYNMVITGSGNGGIRLDGALAFLMQAALG